MPATQALNCYTLHALYMGVVREANNRGPRRATVPCGLVGSSTPQNFRLMVHCPKRNVPSGLRICWMLQQRRLICLYYPGTMGRRRSHSARGRLVRHRPHGPLVRANSPTVSHRRAGRPRRDSLFP